VLEGQVVVITGASAGVGRACAVEFARHGAAVGLIARGRAGLTAAAREVEAAGARAHIAVADVADADAVEAAAAAIETALGPIDVWVNNAMVTVYGRFTDLTPQEYRRVTDVTYHGFAWGTMAALRRMRPRDSGVIVQVGSALAERGIPLQSAYCGAKHATEGMTDSIRSELLAEGSEVHIATVHLPAINTPQFTWNRAKTGHHPQPVPPIFQPELAATAVREAVEQRRREVWLAWPTVQTVLGERVLPSGLADRYLARNAVDAQSTGDPLAPDRPDILFEPVDYDAGARGPFDDRAETRSLQYELSRRRRASLAAIGAVAVGGAAIWAARRRG
jgi:NAD(P)-dependent dehydrogenase (short-subunit alcohol dehydrogenase family)